MCVFQLSFILALVSPCVSDIFTNGITRNLAHPKKSLMGLYTKLDIEKYNNVMIKNVVKLCQIQCNQIYSVLQVGFGPGLGLQEALKYPTDPRGRLLGLDSEYMQKVALERLGPQLASGRVHLLLGRVECIPLPDHCISGNHSKSLNTIPSISSSPVGGKMLATCDLGFLRHGVERGFFKGKTVEPEPYLQALRAVGFLGVSMKDLTDEGKSFQVIYTTSPPPSTTETQTR
uniref:Methyltransferase domain-containing protein n=1 Tax=Oncorhynchus mykiss TaxID=8022 RepID=A0A8C7RNG2_ONCMY